MQTASLFDGPDAWLESPRQAFEALLASPEFVLAGRPRHARVGDKIRDASATVYKAQWTKFESWLQSRNLAFHQATTRDIERFLAEGLGSRNAVGPAPATRQRYASLLERAYGQAVKVGAIPSSPLPPELLRHVATHARASMPVDAEPQEIKKLIEFLTSLVDLGLAKDPLQSWRTTRDAVMAVVALSGGLRCKEISHLKRSQLRHEGPGRGVGRLVLSFSDANTTNTAQQHYVKLDESATELLDAWLAFRFGVLLDVLSASNARHGRAKVTANEHDPVFPSRLTPPKRPSNKDGNLRLSDDAINKCLKDLATQANMAGALADNKMWILATGARGLRRARIVLDLKAGKVQDHMQSDLGLWSARSVARYQEELENAPATPPATSAAPGGGLFARRD